MAEHVEPRIGDWYKTIDGASFEILDIDMEESTIEIQYFDGSLEELEMESWNLMDIVPREPPEDWSGPFDDLVKDDFGDNGDAMHPTAWSGPLDAIEGDIEWGND